MHITGQHVTHLYMYDGHCDSAVQEGFCQRHGHMAQNYAEAAADIAAAVAHEQQEATPDANAQHKLFANVMGNTRILRQPAVMPAPIEFLYDPPDDIPED